MCIFLEIGRKRNYLLCILAKIFYIHIKRFLFKGANSKFWSTFKYCFWYLPWEGRFEESPFNDLAHKPKGWCQKKEGDHFTFNGTCSTINCQKGMIDSHSKKLLSVVPAHILQVNCLDFWKKCKNLRKWPDIFKNCQKVDKRRKGIISHSMGRVQQ